MRYIAKYVVLLQIEADSFEHATKIANSTKRNIKLDGPILNEVRDETYDIGLDWVTESKKKN